MAVKKYIVYVNCLGWYVEASNKISAMRKGFWYYMHSSDINEKARKLRKSDKIGTKLQIRIERVKDFPKPIPDPTRTQTIEEEIEKQNLEESE